MSPAPATQRHRPAPSAFVVEELDPLRSGDWDASLARFPEASVFHSSRWAAVLQDTYGFRPLYLRASSKGAPLALLPLMEAGGLLTGKRGVSLPFTDECPPLFSEQAALDELLEHAVSLGLSRRWKSLELRGGPAPAGSATPSTSFLGHRLSLSLPSEALFRSLPSATRRAVQKARKAGLSVESVNTLDGIREYYRLHCLTRQVHGVPPQSLGFFEALHSRLLAQGGGRVLLARLAGVPVAGAVFLNHGRSVVYKFGASDRRHLDSRPNNLVMWEAIRIHSELGFDSLDFGRTSRWNEGLRDFKMGWTPVERQVDYFRLKLPERVYTSAPDLASGLHTRLFRNLPIWLARLAGKLLYRHLA
jgi:CelD/BcsL family acetyltransferase involved in cellulose biosynthesis